jgi:hypothetical protein
MTLEQERVVVHRAGVDSNPQLEERVSILVGDRLCITCGYNLTGQNVLREPHYRMLIVRCPECATVASVQEYPLLGRWASRWAKVLAGLCVMVIVAVWIGSGAAIFGISYAMSEVSADRYRTVIDQLYYASGQQSAAPVARSSGRTPSQPIPPPPPMPMTIQVPGQQSIVIQNVPGSSVSGFGNWWAGQNRTAILADAGGWMNVVEWRALWLWLPLGLVTFLIGCVWSVMLLARRGVSLLACGLGILCVALFLAFFPLYEWFTDMPWSGRAAARAEISPVFLVLSMAMASIPLSMGLLLGRRVARGVVKLMLPPRLCSALALLWTVDGLPPPRPGVMRG